MNREQMKESSFGVSAMVAENNRVAFARIISCELLNFSSPDLIKIKKFMGGLKI